MSYPQLFKGHGILAACYVSRRLPCLCPGACGIIHNTDNYILLVACRCRRPLTENFATCDALESEGVGALIALGARFRRRALPVRK